MLSIFRICGQLHRQIEVAFGMHVSDCIGPKEPNSDAGLAS